VGSLLFSEPRVDFDPDRGCSTHLQGVDRPTFEELYLQHFDLARSAIRRKGVKRPAEIEELAQEVFIIVHRRLPELDFIRSNGKEPVLGAAFGVLVTLVYVHRTRTPTRETMVQPVVTLTREADTGPAAPGALNGLTEETSAALVPAGGGVDPSKAANPAALLALRKAQAAYVVGDRAAALDALSGFEREFADDPLRISAERLRALVLRPLAANR
jgi:DNA-directed RNA polymerase specialized sigma24 family protein